MRPLVIYHAGCFDGFCAAWVARKSLGPDCDFVAQHYDMAPPDVAGREVYILDFSYKRPVMMSVIASARSTIVLDHHQTAEAELAGLAAPNLALAFDMAKSGARLTWEHFFPDQQSPWLVDYTEDRDLWRNALPNTLEVNANLRSHPFDFATWDALEIRKSGWKEWELFLDEGRAIRRLEAQIVRTHVRNAHEVEIDGHKILAVNATVYFSEIAGELAAGRPFGACYFIRKDGRRQWAVRSREGGVDVSVIARARGGGGHRNAAGWTE